MANSPAQNRGRQQLLQKPKEWDGDWRLVDFDPFTDTSEWYLYNGDNTITIRKIAHNVDQLLDANAEEFNAHLNARWGDGKKVASIPPALFEELGLDKALQEGDKAHFKRIINDSDFAKFRTFGGRI